MKNPFKINELNEEQILKVLKYFDTRNNWHGDTSWEKESQIRARYWILHAKWELTIDVAEQEKLKSQKRDWESYKRFKEQEIKEHLKAYRQEEYWNEWVFELMRVYEREDWRQINIWIMKTDDWIRRTHAIEIEERRNPEYFQEIINRYKLLID